MKLTNEMLKNGIWVKDLVLEEHGFGSSHWDFRDDAYLDGDSIMLMGDCMCNVSDYGRGWRIDRPKKYKNTITGEWTEDRDTVNKWYEEGADIEFWHYDEMYAEWVNYMDMVH